MYLKKLELQGFKSFALKTTLDFEAGKVDGRRIAAIVGPNGSGKSNVADAVRWVLGEQSLKMLRGKKAEDIIFAGTDKKARLGAAEVSLYLDNSDHKMPLDYEEVVLTRKVFRDGNSEYLINQGTVRRFDVIELLAKAGFGQATYAVVGQGMVDAVLSATPVERKVMFEEATGVKKYYLKRDRAIRKLEHAKDNLVRVKDIITELEPRLRILKRQAKRAQERGQVETELKSLQKNYYTLVYQELDNQLQSVLKQVNDYQGQIDVKQKELAQLKSEIQELDAATKDAVNVDQSKQQELTVLEEKHLGLRQKLAVIQGKIEAEEERGGENPELIQAKAEGLKNEIAKVQNDIESAKQEQEKINQSLWVINTKKQELEKQLAVQREKLTELQKVTQGNGGLDVGFLKSEVKVILDDQSLLLNKISSVRDLSELEELKQLAGKTKERLATLAESLEKVGQNEVQNQFAAIQGEINKLIEEKDQLNQEEHEKKIQLAKIEQKLEFLGSGIDEKQSKLDELNLRAGQTKGSANVVITDLLKKQKENQESLNEVEAQLAVVRKVLSSQNEEYQTKRRELLEKERVAQTKQQEIEKLQLNQNQISVEKVRFETRLEGLKVEIEKELGADFKVQSYEFKSEEGINKEELELKIQKLQHRLELSGGIDPEVIAEYEECQERYDFLTKQSEDLRAASQSLNEVIKKLDAMIKKQFDEYFGRISLEFKHYFKALFSGGDANLSLREDEELGESVVEIEANLPGKRIKTINSLSGGERALTSVALLFAILAVNPSPFCVLDEVDAALDEANSKKFGEILESLSEKTQFILITHNRETMRRSYLLYGVTMEESGVSKLLSIKLEEGEKLVKQRRDYHKS